MGAEGEGKTRTFKITNITYDTYDEEAEEHQTQEDLELPTEMVVQIELQGDEEEWEIYDLLTYQIENQGYGWLVESFDFDTESKSAEGLEFTDWAKQEHHGKKTSLKDWADHEIKTHGKSMSFQDWAKHEDKSHIRRYGAEEYIDFGLGGYHTVPLPHIEFMEDVTYGDDIQIGFAINEDAIDRWDIQVNDRATHGRC
jgi:hypothetical protein